MVDYRPLQAGKALSLIDGWEDRDLQRQARQSLKDAPDLIQAVKTFHQVYGLPIIPPSEAREDFSHISKERLAMRFGLIVEEFRELCDSMDIRANVSFSYMDEDEGWVIAKNLEEAIVETDARSLPDMSDACIDLAYVIIGMMFEVGAHPHAVLREVQASNMSKLNKDGSVLRREDGKVLKGENYFKADVEAALMAYGMRMGAAPTLSTKPLQTTEPAQHVAHDQTDQDYTPPNLQERINKRLKEEAPSDPRMWEDFIYRIVAEETPPGWDYIDWLNVTTVESQHPSIVITQIPEGAKA